MSYKTKRKIEQTIFGLLTGYQFHSLRFGKIMLAKKEDKLHICRYHMPGTGGQCIMSAPAGDAENMPVVLYTLVVHDEKKAATFAKRVETSVKNYPYPKDVAMEKE